MFYQKAIFHIKLLLAVWDRCVHLIFHPVFCKPSPFSKPTSTDESFGDGVCFLKPQQRKSYAPFAPHPPRSSGQEGSIGRLIFLFLKICTVQRSRLVGVNENQNMTKASLVVEGMFGVFDPIFALVIFQILREGSGGYRVFQVILAPSLVGSI